MQSVTQSHSYYFLGMIHKKITRNDKFWNESMEKELIDYYENRMLPEILSYLLNNNDEV